MSLMDILMEGRTSPQDRYAMIQQMGGMGGGMPAGGMGGMGGTSNWEQRARQMAMNRYGYSPQEWQALDSIIERESGWDPNAVNEGSGAYGIPQILPSAHPDANLQNDPIGQLRWLFKYIQGRYGGPTEALAFKDSHGWY